jgi:hypothetical protein
MFPGTRPSRDPHVARGTAPVMTLVAVLGALVAGFLIGRAASPRTLPGPAALPPPVAAKDAPTLVGREPTDTERRLRAEIERLRARIALHEVDAGAPPDPVFPSAGSGERAARLEAVRQAAERLTAAEAALLPEDRHRPFPADRADPSSDLPGWGSPSRVHVILSLDDVPAYSSWIAERASRHTMEQLSQVTDPSIRARIDAVVRSWIATELDAMLGARRAWSGLAPSARDAAQRAYTREAFDRRVDAADRVRKELEAVLGAEALTLRLNLLP